MKPLAGGASILVALLLSGCTDPAQIRAENRASDRQRCSDYGYQEGTDAFANCMERSDGKREYAEQQEVQERKARMRELALKRSGDDRYPICSAVTPNVELDVEGFWYADGCRAR